MASYNMIRLVSYDSGEKLDNQLLQKACIDKFLRDKILKNIFIDLSSKVKRFISVEPSEQLPLMTHREMRDCSGLRGLMKKLSLLSSGWTETSGLKMPVTLTEDDYDNVFYFKGAPYYRKTTPENQILYLLHGHIPPTKKLLKLQPYSIFVLLLCSRAIHHNLCSEMRNSSLIDKVCPSATDFQAISQNSKITFKPMGESIFDLENILGVLAKNNESGIQLKDGVMELGLAKTLDLTFRGSDLSKVFSLVEYLDRETQYEFSNYNIRTPSLREHLRKIFNGERLFESFSYFGNAYIKRPILCTDFVNGPSSKVYEAYSDFIRREIEDLIPMTSLTYIMRETAVKICSLVFTIFGREIDSKNPSENEDLRLLDGLKETEYSPLYNLHQATARLVKSKKDAVSKSRGVLFKPLYDKDITLSIMYMILHGILASTDHVKGIYDQFAVSSRVITLWEVCCNIIFNFKHSSSAEYKSSFVLLVNLDSKGTIQTSTNVAQPSHEGAMMKWRRPGYKDVLCWEGRTAREGNYSQEIKGKRHQSYVPIVHMETNLCDYKNFLGSTKVTCTNMKTFLLADDPVISVLNRYVTSSLLTSDSFSMTQYDLLVLVNNDLRKLSNSTLQIKRGRHFRHSITTTGVIQVINCDKNAIRLLFSRSIPFSDAIRDPTLTTTNLMKQGELVDDNLVALTIPGKRHVLHNSLHQDRFQDRVYSNSINVALSVLESQQHILKRILKKKLIRELKESRIANELSEQMSDSDAMCVLSDFVHKAKALFNNMQFGENTFCGHRADLPLPSTGGFMEGIDIPYVPTTVIEKRLCSEVELIKSLNVLTDTVVNVFNSNYIFISLHDARMRFSFNYTIEKNSWYHDQGCVVLPTSPYCNTRYPITEEASSLINDTVSELTEGQVNRLVEVYPLSLEDDYHKDQNSNSREKAVERAEILNQTMNRILSII
jgi:hypothetical protein